MSDSVGAHLGKMKEGLENGEEEEEEAKETRMRKQEQPGVAADSRVRHFAAPLDASLIISQQLPILFCVQHP